MRLECVVSVPVAAAAVFIAAESSFAGSLRTWCGPSGEQDWSAATNWVGGAVATGDDSAYFPMTAVASSSGMGKRWYSFKITPPAEFAGTILTTNELHSSDGMSSTYQNRSFRPKVELGVVEGASWTVAGNGCVVATTGLAARISEAFSGEIEVRAGDTFSPPATLGGGVRFTGAGTLVLPSGAQFAQAEAFAGTIMLSSSGSFSGATLAPLQNSTLHMADGQSLSFDASSLAMRQISKIDGFADDPGKWSFNGTTWASGNLPSGPFNPNPPYVRDGELWLTDEPAQIHTAWYTNRTFSLTDDWGMSFTYMPELPDGTRITTELRADGNTRSQTLCGYFGILFSRASPTNVGSRSSSGYVSLANDAYGFIIDLYRSSPQAKVMWVSESNYGDSRSMWESETGIRLDRKMDVTVAMIRGEMTVTLAQNGKSASFSHSFAKALETMAAGGCYIGLGGESHWWGDGNSVPWVRSRVSNFRAWYRDETDGPGWAPIDNAASFDISDSTRWNYGKAIWTSDSEKTDRSDTLFASDGVQLTDADYSNCAYILSKAYPPKRSEPLCFSYRFRTSDPNWTSTADGVITFFFGSNFANTQSNGATLNNSHFGNYGKGLDWIWEVNGGTTSLNYSYHKDARNSLASAGTFGGLASRDVAAMKSPEKDLRADIVWNPNGTFKAFTSIAARNRTGEGRCGSVTYTGLDEKTNYATFTNREDWSVGVKSFCRSKAYAAITMTDMTIKRLAAAVGGEAFAVEVPEGASSSIVAGSAKDGQSAPVLSVGALDLGAGATLTIAPESAQTVVNVGSVTSAGGMLAAANGAEVRVGDALTIAPGTMSPGLTTTGNVVFGERLSLSVPNSWRKSKGEVVAIAANGISGSIAIDPAKVTVSSEGVAIPGDRCRVSVKQNRLLLNFERGFVLVVR